MKQIFLLEDDETLGRGIAMALTGSETSVTCRSTLAKAREALLNERFDLLILDVNLPDGSGLDLLRQVRSEGDATPVILLTANDLELDEVTGLEAGADDYITKPFSLAVLRARVNAQLRRSTPKVSPTTLHGSQLADFRGKKLGFIFQDFNLLDTLTAYENISLALSIAGTKPSEIQKCVPQIAKALNIQEVLNKYPYQMSGGQQQRVAAARAMVTNPAIVLADEPTGALDSNSSRMLLTMLTELNEQLAATILMVTHDAFSASYCHRILFIKDGQVFNELHRGTDTRKDFFAKILEVVSVLGGEQNDPI